MACRCRCRRRRSPDEHPVGPGRGDPAEQVRVHSVYRVPSPEGVFRLRYGDHGFRRARVLLGCCGGADGDVDGLGPVWVMSLRRARGSLRLRRSSRRRVRRRRGFVVSSRRLRCSSRVRLRRRGLRDARRRRLPNGHVEPVRCGRFHHGRDPDRRRGGHGEADLRARATSCITVWRRRRRCSSSPGRTCSRASSRLPSAVGGGAVLPLAPASKCWFFTDVGAALSMVMSAATQVGGSVAFIQV
jgi:hypothetical protein